MIKNISITLVIVFQCIIIQAQQLKPIIPNKNEVTEIKKPLINVTNVASPVHSDYDAINFTPIQSFSIKAGYSELSIYHTDKNGRANFIKGELSKERRSSDLKIQMKQYLKEAGSIMQLKDEDQNFELISEVTDKLEHTHFKTQQKLNDIPIYGAEVILHSKGGIIHSLNGNYLSSEELKPNATTAVIAINEVEDLVKAELSIYRDYSDKNDWLYKMHKQWEKNLVYFIGEEGLILAYHVKVYPHLGEWLTYFIDANTGEVLSEYSNICKLHGKHITPSNNPEETPSIESEDHANCSHAAPPNGPATATATDLLGNNVSINTYEVNNTYFMIDGSRDMFNLNQSTMPNEPVGAIWTVDAFDTSPQSDNFSYGHVTSNNNSWNQEESVSSQNNAGIVYEYFKNTFGRESLDGSGGTILSFVNVSAEDGSSFGNAFWNGVAIFYGNGDSSFRPLGRSLDVAGHEISHGVVQNTANLEYQGESGAINESVADVMGAMIDRDDWLLGEDVVRLNAYPSGALRDMEDPGNGATPGDYFGGWQPSHVNDQYMGSADFGGVHINSGITNRAYYLLATDIGKAKAEQIMYRALTVYLTRSSQFVDLRAGMDAAANDLYGTAEVNAVRAAYDAVGIVGAGGNYQQDADENPGQDLILFTDPNKSNLFLVDAEGNYLANPLSETDILSKPSVTDDGSVIIFIGADKKMHRIVIDWAAGNFTESTIVDDPIWKNAIVSKDGSRIAALTDNVVPQISVFDFGLSAWNDFDLYNPTYSEGVNTGDVLFADVMEFDLTSNYILYDAASEITSASSGTIEYWDIGLLQVWNPSADTWALGEIAKPFPALPDGVSIGNPTFSKNSPYIIAFDLIDADGGLQVLGANLETGNVGLIYDNNVLGYPSYSTADDRVIIDLEVGNYEELGVLNLNGDKISANPPSDTPWFFTAITPSQWGVWFSNGDRDLTSIENVIAGDDEFKIYPNPASSNLTLEIDQSLDIESLTIIDVKGQLVKALDVTFGASEINLNVASLENGLYFVRLHSKEKQYNRSFIINK